MGHRSYFFFQAEDGIRDKLVTGVQTCALPICRRGQTVVARDSTGRWLRYSRAPGRCAIEKVLLAPFRSGTPHIVIFGVVFPARPIPAWVEKRHQRADDAAEMGSKHGCSDRKLSHWILHAIK